MRSQWTPGHLNEWQQSVDRLAGALMDKPTANLTQTDVVSVIKPIWATTNETARRVLGRIDQTIEHAMAVDPGRFSGSNPCNNVLRLLPRVSTVVKPRPAIPWRDLPIFFSLAPTPGGSGTRARTVVARLLPQNWRSHAGDVERDRRQPKARTCRAQETRWRTDDPFERCCDGSAGQHQATRAPMGQDLVADDQVLHQHLAGRRGDPRARTEAKNTNIRAVADGVLRDDEWRAVADSSEIQRLILDAPLVTVSKPLAPLAVAPGANGNAVSSIVSPITNPPIVALTAPACSAIRTPALPWKVIVAPGAVPFTSSVAPLSIRTPPPPARGPDSFSSPDLAPHDVPEPTRAYVSSIGDHWLLGRLRNNLRRRAGFDHDDETPIRRGYEPEDGCNCWLLSDPLGLLWATDCRATGDRVEHRCCLDQFSMRRRVY